MPGVVCIATVLLFLLPIGACAEGTAANESAFNLLTDLAPSVII
jgi:hypothetical protein